MHRLVGVAVATILLFLQSTDGGGPASLKTEVFHSPPFDLGPGSVANKYYNIHLPKGHIALKSFDAEVVDDAGNSVPLHQTYLHHWLVVRYYGLVGTDPSPTTSAVDEGPLFHLPERLPARNSGVCPNTLSQFFGLGSETRRTPTWVPDPYGIEIGNPEEIPAGYEERWMLNVHAIDTREVEDRTGCTECRCDLYNVTTRFEGYVGGLFCCKDEAQCRLKTKKKEGHGGSRKTYYLRYRVRWVDWTDAVVPVNIYIFDVTYTGGQSSRRVSGSHCKVEYDIESCGVAEDDCLHVKRAKAAALPRGGDVVYAVGHQHMGGLGIALYGQDGRLVCSSVPKYGKGEEAGNEAGYVVGMSTCYPTPNSLRVADGETLTLESNYSSSQIHTGVMGLFYVLVAEPRPNIFLPRPSTKSNDLLA